MDKQKGFICLLVTLSFGFYLAYGLENISQKKDLSKLQPSWLPSYELSWAALPNVPTACYLTAGVCLNNIYYQICGSQISMEPWPYIQVWNGSGWSQSSAHPAFGVYAHSATTWNGKIVVSGGPAFSGFCNYTAVYNPADNSWFQSTPMPLNNMRYTAMSSVNNKCYLFGGSITGVAKNTTYAWTPGDANMISKANMPGTRFSQAASTYNGNIYLFGGSDSYGPITNEIWKYDPIADHWTIQNATLSTLRQGACAVTIGDRIFIIGGRSDTGLSILNSVDVYNPINDSIATGTPLPYATTDFAASGYLIPGSSCTYTGKIIVSGGWNSLSGPDAVPLPNAELGMVLNFSCIKVEPTSLGRIKGLFH